MDERTRASATLILFPGALGDAVCLEPTIARLSADGPVALWARDAAKEVATLFPSRPLVDSLDRREVAALFAPRRADGADDLGDVFLESFGRVRSFTGASAPELQDRFRRHPDARAVPFPPRDADLHASHLLLRGALDGSGMLAPFPRLDVRGAERPGKGGRLLMHPGSGGRGKRAPQEVFASVARSWRERGGDVGVVLGPAEPEEQNLWASSGTVAVPESVQALALILTRARVYLGYDAGPSHMAAALGVPTVVVFVGSIPESFGPRGPDVRWIDARRTEDRAAIAEAAWGAVARHLP